MPMQYFMPALNLWNQSDDDLSSIILTDLPAVLFNTKCCWLAFELALSQLSYADCSFCIILICVKLWVCFPGRLEYSKVATASSYPQWSFIGKGLQDQNNPSTPTLFENSINSLIFEIFWATVERALDQKASRLALRTVSNKNLSGCFVKYGFLNFNRQNIHTSHSNGVMSASPSLASM